MNTDRFHKHESMLRNVLELQHRIWERMNQVEVPPSKAWYTPAEIAKILHRKQDTIRGWCRNRRLDARKRLQGRGDKLEWEISAKELQRYQDHGLLPLRTNLESELDRRYSQRKQRKEVDF